MSRGTTSPTRRRLRSGNVLWPAQNSEPARHPALDEDLVCEVAIVGAGVIGALIAYRLAGTGLSVVLVDKGRVGAGSTSASTALLMYQLDLGLAELSERIGVRKAVRAYRVSRRAIRTIKALADELGLARRFRAKKVLYVASEAPHAAELYKEYEALRENGFNVTLVDRVRLKREFAIDKPAALIVHEAAEVDPVALTQSLVRHARAAGVRVHDDTEIAQFDGEGGGAKILTTTAGHRITCHHAVFATGYESERYLAKKILLLKSTYVTATAPSRALRPRWLDEYMVWETARPYLYIRTTPDGRILIGGADTKIVAARQRDALIARKGRVLRHKFTALTGREPSAAAYGWAGTFGETKDGLGYIGSPRGSNRIYFALGFGGNGITFGVIAADLISRLVQKKKTADLALFAFDR
jgi:glycine/D-amino acid oxidase-like deaminating enzyme